MSGNTQPYKLKVMVGVPTWDGMVHLHVKAACTVLSHDKRYDVTLSDSIDRPYASNVNKLQQRALTGGFDWLLTMDADNPPALGKNPLDNVAKGYHIVGYPTPIFSPSEDPAGRCCVWNVFNVDLEAKTMKQYVPDKGGVHEVGAVGSGCMLFSRHALETIVPLNVRGFDEKGIAVLGGDISCCIRAKQAGIPVHADFDRPCSHFTRIDILSLVLRDNARIEAAAKAVTP